MLPLLLACAAEAPPPPPPYRVFPSAAEAVSALLAEEQPRVLGVGEVHATTDGPAGPSILARFTDTLMPVLAPVTTDLVIETWRLDRTCGVVATQVVETVEVETKRPEVTKDEITLLAEKANALGVKPHDLVITCEEYGLLQDEAGEVDYDALLGLLTDKLGDYALRGLDTPGARLVLYGGAMHNDLHPREGMERWTYGPRARDHSADAYVELDVYAPELVAGMDLILEPGWAPLLQTAVGPDRAVLYARGPQSYVLLLPSLP